MSLLPVVLLVLQVQTLTVVHVTVQGETNLTTNFIETFKSEARAAGLEV